MSCEVVSAPKPLTLQLTSACAAVSGRHSNNVRMQLSKLEELLNYFIAW